MSYANAWRKWSYIIERGAAPLSARMVELSELDLAMSVLDIGTGTGEPGLSAAQTLRHPGRVFAIDPDENMIALARENALNQGVDNIDFQVASVESARLNADSFDVILARWSLMFVSDLAATASRLYNALRPNGRLVVATWAAADQVPALSLAKSVVHQHFGLPGSPHAANRTFALSDKTKLASLFSKAGFSEVTIGPFPVTYEFASSSEYIQYRLEVAGPLWSGMNTSPAKEVESVFAAIETALEPYKKPGGGYRLENQAICILCRV